jgi:hypothetical protein
MERKQCQTAMSQAEAAAIEPRVPARVKQKSKAENGMEVVIKQLRQGV